MIEPNRHYQKNPDLVFRIIAGEALLVPIRRDVADLECIYTLNETAARILQLADGASTLAQLCDQIVAEFEVEHATAEKDVLELVTQLIGIDALREV